MAGEPTRTATRGIPGLLLMLLLAYGGMCAWLYAVQDGLMYFPTAEVQSRSAEALELRNDGETLKVWKVGDGSNALLYFGGNAENVAYSIPAFAGLLPDTAVYLHNYRGYGGSSGEPGESAFYSDAALLFDEIRGRHDSVSVVGRSLGSGVASWLAAERPVARLVLVTPFDSIANVAQRAYPFAPVGLLLRDKFASVDYVSRIEAPVLVLAAEDDGIIPRGNTMALVDRFPPRQVRLRTIDGTTHNTISRSPDYARALREFLQPPLRVDSRQP